MGFLKSIFGGLVPPRRQALEAKSSTKNGPELMREMRLGWLDIKCGDQSASVSSALMDWPLGENVVTVCASSVGDASVYTTSTFGILGGIGHETVRAAAKLFIQAAEKCLPLSQPTTEFSYPGSGQVKFFFVTSSSVRTVAFTLADIENVDSPARYLFAHAQKVLTELRIVGENKQVSE